MQRLGRLSRNLEGIDPLRLWGLTSGRWTAMRAPSCLLSLS